MPTALVWLRNDLRLHDHAPSAEATAADRALPVYCLDPRHFAATGLGVPKMGSHRARFLLEGLRDLRTSLRAVGSDLVVRRGRPEDVLPQLAAQAGADRVLVHEEVTSEEVAVDAAVEAALPEGARLIYFWSHTLYHIDDLPFDPERATPGVFTSFRKKVEKYATVREPLPAPAALPPLPEGVEPGAIPTLADLGLPEPPTDERRVSAFPGGEAAALARLEAYLWTGDHLRRYKETRNGLLGEDYSSKLSPWLAHGCLSPRHVHAEVRRYEQERVENDSTYWLIFELIWRDFFRYAALKSGDRLFYASGPAGRARPWRHDRDAFARWAEGATGIPFVDANMRELRLTGFMSNRGRQNVASFLARTLGIDWRWGAAYFESQLLDYDVTSNWGNWAYVAGVGHDPRDRTFNINRQAERYDPDAAYVKHWLPELAPLPPAQARAPWTLSPMEEEMYGVRLGEDYPAPMVR